MTVIFVFLRSVWATVIPSVTIPVALVGTLGAMYVLGYSLDNLSLMGLTIAVGFVVDDAIVMLENIVRHIEEGMKPYDAALKGSGEIGFTIVSISISLIAVFIPLLLMGGIVGRLFREFAIVVSITIVASAIVSLTLTPMMASRFLVSEHGREHGRLYKLVEGMFDAMVGFYERTLDIALRFRFITLMVFFAVVVATGTLFYIIPKGFFPAQDTGIIIAVTDAAQDVSFSAMSDLQQKVNKLVLDDPSVAGLTSSVGAGAGGQTQNNGRMYIQLKPWSERTDNASRIIARLSAKAQSLQGIRLFMQPAQDISVGGRLSRTQYQYTLSDPDGDELNTWAPKLLEKLRKLPQLTDVTSDAAGTGLTLTLTYDKEEAARYGIQPATIDSTLYDAFGQRQVAQYFTGLKAYYVILEVTPKQQGLLDTLRLLYVKSASGALVPLSTIVHQSTAPVQPLVVNHQSQFPSVTISYNLKQGVSLGDSVTEIQKAQAELGVPATVTGAFQGTAQAFQSSLASQPYLIAAALIAVYIILGILYESYILPLTILSTLPSAGVGSAAVPAGVQVRPDRDRDRRHHPADRHREEERHHDGGFRHPRGAQRGQEPVRRDPGSLLAAVPADLDDHDGGAAVWPAADVGHRCRLRTAAPARVRDGGRLGAQPDTDAVYDPGRLPLSRQAADLADARQGTADVARAERHDPGRPGSPAGRVTPDKTSLLG